MKKSALAMITGILLGITLIFGMFTILNGNPLSDEEIYSPNIVENENNVVDAAEVKEEKIQFTEDTGEFLKKPVFKPRGKKVETGEADETDKTKTEQTPAEVYQKNPYYIKVNRLANCVTIYTLDGEGNYTIPVKAMTCSVGTDGKTPLGISKISNKYAWRYLFGNSYGQYSVRFNGHILFHSVPYRTSSADTLKEGQFNLLGQPASLGCVRLCVADAKWIYDNCAKGTTVEVYDSQDPGPLGKPSMPQIDPNSPYKGWDPTDPNPSNPWLYGRVSITGIHNISVEKGKEVDLLQDISASDADGISIPVTVSGTVDFNTVGEYEICYSATGVLGETITQKAVVTVTSTQVPDNGEEEGTTGEPNAGDTAGEPNTGDTAGEPNAGDTTGEPTTEEISTEMTDAPSDVWAKLQKFWMQIWKI